MFWSKLTWQLLTFSGKVCSVGRLLQFNGLNNSDLTKTENGMSQNVWIKGLKMLIFE